MHDFEHWLEFGIFVVILLALDLLVFNKKAHEVKIKEALGWSAFWIALGIGFGGVVYYWYGHELTMQYYAAYFVEKSLSMDNLFVFLMIFNYFKVPQIYQHRVLFWGIIGALVLRFVFIFLGVALINQFEWVLYIFGVILIWSAYKMVKDQDHEIHPENNSVIKLFKRIMPVTTEYDGGNFFTVKNAKKYATPLFVALIMIETSDVIFAVDSIPAIFGISQDIFVIYTSNIMAILGLRALYFAISAIMKYFRYLNYGLAIILGFVGIKMMIATADIYHIPVLVSLGVIGATMAISILLSVMIKDPKAEAHEKELLEGKQDSHK